MENSILVSLSSQNVLQRQLSSIASNLANINTSGFKAERLLVVEHRIERLRSGPGNGETSLVRDLATVRDRTDGRIEETGNPLDVALRGDTFLVVNTSQGERSLSGGHLRLDESGRVVSESGDPVQGASGAPIVLAPEDGAPLIATDGTVSGDQGVIGKLRVVEFPGTAQLLPVGGGMMTTDSVAGDAVAPSVLQGKLERPNVEPITEIERLIQVQRAYDQARMAIDREDERIRKMMTVYAG